MIYLWRLCCSAVVSPRRAVCWTLAHDGLFMARCILQLQQASVRLFPHGYKTSSARLSEQSSPLLNALGYHTTSPAVGRAQSCNKLQGIYSLCPKGLSGLRAMSAKRKRTEGESDYFEQWLAANPLPDMSKGKELEETDFEQSGEYDMGIGHSKKSERKTGKSSRVEPAVGTSFRSGDYDGNISGENVTNLIRQEDERGYELKVMRIESDPGYTTRKFSWRETADVLYECLCKCDDLIWDADRKKFVEVNPQSGQMQMEFIPPLIQPPPHSCCTPRAVVGYILFPFSSMSRYLESLRGSTEGKGKKQLLALVTSSAASLGIFLDGSLLLHKVITAYTVRAKQGKSQLKYIRQGAPGRMTVGGRLRAQETNRFFSRVCKKLHEWSKEIQDCDLLYFSGTTRVWNEVYAQDNPTMPVTRDDGRWCKVPYSVPEPRLRELERVFHGLCHGELVYVDSHDGGQTSV